MGIADWRMGSIGEWGQVKFHASMLFLARSPDRCDVSPEGSSAKPPSRRIPCSRQIHRRICAQPTLPLPAFRVGRIMVFGNQEEAQEMVLTEDDGPTCLGNADRVDRMDVGR
jgi:hypothetical protein